MQHLSKNLLPQDLLFSFLADFLNADSDGEFNADSGKGKLVKYQSQVLVIFGNPPSTTTLSADNLSHICESIRNDSVSIQESVSKNDEIFKKFIDKLPWNTNIQNPATLGGNDLFNPALNRGINSEDGMVMGRNHPIFQQEREINQLPDGYLSPLSVPPGARFDPIIPDGDNPMGLLRKKQSSGDPNPDLFQPPNAFGNNKNFPF